MRSAYDGAIAYTDHHLGRIFEALENAGILENTIVIVTADHGELFGEHGLREHYTNLYMPVLHVPLIMAYPPRIPPSARVTRPVSIRDIPATVLELTFGHPGPRLPGNSLSWHWSTDMADETPAAGEDDVAEPLPVLAETRWSEAGQVLDWEPLARGSMKSLVIGDMHYILNGDGVEELYDLSVDPEEERDLSGQPQSTAVLEQARFSLDSILSRSPAR